MSNQVNFGNVADDYAKYRDEIPSIIFDQLKERNVEFFGKSVIDLGSGSGIFSRAMANQGANVIGVEPEDRLITQAVEKDKSLEIKINYIHSTAEEVTLSSDSYDIIIALRAWHYDRKIVNEQVMRLLKANGYLLVIHSIFVPQTSQEVQETIRAIKEFITDLKPAGSMGDVKERRMGFPVNWFEEWIENGFQIIDEWQHDYSLTFSVNDWCGKIKSLSWLTAESEETKEMIIAKVKEYLKNYNEPLSIPHRYSVVVLKK
jgi:ubiquinone/menaquinone biosynthesis C-methylase UbiE